MSLSISYLDILAGDSVKISKVCEVDWGIIRPGRGGVIVYTTLEDDTYFGLGIDAKSGDYTDFGGGIRYKKDGTAVRGSLREFIEETLGVFGWISEDQITEAVAVYSSSMIIFFIRIEFSPGTTSKSISDLFDRRLKFLTDPEVSKIVWLKSAEFVELLTTWHFEGRKLYSRVGNLLNNVEFWDFL